MALAYPRSVPLTNSEALPIVMNPMITTRGTLHESVAVVECVSGDDNDSVYCFVALKSTDRVSRVLLSCDVITTGTTDVGLFTYTVGTSEPVTVDRDFFASAVALTSALVHSDVTHEADAADGGAGYGLADTLKPLWQAAGLSADTGLTYYVGLMWTDGPSSTGTISLKVQYVSSGD